MSRMTLLEISKAIERREVNRQEALEQHRIDKERATAAQIFNSVFKLYEYNRPIQGRAFSCTLDPLFKREVYSVSVDGYDFRVVFDRDNVPTLQVKVTCKSNEFWYGISDAISFKYALKAYGMID